MKKKNKIRENRVSEWRQTIPGKKNTIPLVYQWYKKTNINEYTLSKKNNTEPI